MHVFTHTFDYIALGILMPGAAARTISRRENAIHRIEWIICLSRISSGSLAIFAAIRRASSPEGRNKVIEQGIAFNLTLVTGGLYVKCITVLASSRIQSQ